jgi:hypothetical protein
MDIYERDSAGGHWRSVAIPPAIRREAPAATSLAGHLFFIGGSTSGGIAGPAEIYDPSVDSWTELPKSTIACDSGCSVAVGADQRVYAVGISAANANGQVKVFDANGWADAASLPQDVILPQLARGRDGRLYAVSTGYGFVLSMKVYVYGPVLALNASHAPSGSTIQVHGSNFATRALVELHWDDGGAVVASGQSDDQGVFANVDVVVPGPGNHRLFAVDDRSRYPVSVPFAAQ